MGKEDKKLAGLTSWVSWKDEEVGGQAEEGNRKACGLHPIILFWIQKVGIFNFTLSLLLILMLHMERCWYACSGMNLQNEWKKQGLVNPFFNSLWDKWEKKEYIYKEDS
jgi:hypothetical protein